MNSFFQSLLTLHTRAAEKGLLPAATGDAARDAAAKDLVAAVEVLASRSDDVSVQLQVLDAIHGFAHAADDRRGEYYNTIMRLPGIADTSLLSEWLQANTDGLRASFRADVRRALPQAAVRVDNQFTPGPMPGQLVLQVYVREDEMERTMSLPLQVMPDAGGNFAQDMKWLTFATTDISRFLKHLLRRIEREELFGAAMRSHRDHQRVERLVLRVAAGVTLEERALLLKYPDMLLQALRG
ncbi:hypothetical protein D3C71_25580 [compost metagenome]